MSFSDDLQGTWGEVSGQVNLFNADGSIAAFAKLDVTFGEDLEGVGGQVGMRFDW